MTLGDLVLGTFSGVVTSLIFYRIGRHDGESAYRVMLLSAAILRLKQMMPTTRGRVANGYGLDETAHLFTCLAEMAQLRQYPEGSDVLLNVAESLRLLPDIEVR